MVRIENIKVREDLTDSELINYVCKKNRININEITNWNIFKKSIDARNKDDIYYNYTIDIELKNEKKLKNVKIINDSEKLIDKIENNCKYKKPVIIGAGPAGLFAALTLAQNGVKPIVIEQGKTVDERKKDVDEFLKTGKLNCNSNVQFGEGGAGTFSDGKLTTGINNPLCRKVLQEFYNFGAPKEILYINKPHIGTDNLINVIRNMRNEIIRLGGEFLFNNKVTDFEFENNEIKAVICNERIETDCVILAVGHSARDLFKVLHEKGVVMEKKNFSVGVRIEHKQELINKSQYGEKTKLKLPPAEYKLAYHGENRSCYTFCMCPGGTVMASSSEENTIVTNGMSKFARDGENANSAVLVDIKTTDFNSDDVLEGMYFQKSLEEAAFKLGGGNYFAPIQLVGDFLNNKKSTQIGEVKPTYKPGVTLSNLNDILPEFVSKTLKEGIVYFDKKIKGFAKEDAILTGVETRSSSPIKILRNEELCSNIKGLYPCGEGAGYAGGIMSAGVDGIKCAIKILS